MNLILLMIGIWFASFLLIIVALALMLYLIQPKNYKIDSGDRTTVFTISFLISTAITFIMGGILG